MPDRTQLLLNESQEGALIPDWEDVENWQLQDCPSASTTGIV